MKYLYKYPQAAYPYWDLVEQEPAARPLRVSSTSCVNTGIFDANRYFDVFVEYAKNTPEDLLIRITVVNRGPEKAAVHVLPTLWFRNEWSWGKSVSRPELCVARTAAPRVVLAIAPKAGEQVSLLRGRARPALHRERDQPAPYPRRQWDERPVREGRNQRLRRCWHRRTASTRRRWGRRRPRSIASKWAPVRPRSSACVSATATLPGGTRIGSVLRRRLRRAQERGRRVLPRHHATHARRRRSPHLPPSNGGDALEQAVLQLRRRAVAPRARQRGLRPPPPPRTAKRRLEPHVQWRHHLDARQVGVSLVCGLGSRLPRRRVRANGRQLRQDPAGPDAARSVLAPERADPGVRVELRRREPPRARLGDDLRLPAREVWLPARGTSSGSRDVSRSSF